MSSYSVIISGPSRSFPEPHGFIDAATPRGEGIVILGPNPAPTLAGKSGIAQASFVAVELGTECLAVHAGLSEAEAGSNLVGFARFRMGSAAPTNLVELVRQPWTSANAIDAARAAFVASGLEVALCEDFPGRIIDRLLRPYLNAVLRRHDEGLASAADLDKTLMMGLGYPEGPLAMLARTGLAAHYDITQSLYIALGQGPYAPARAAQVAKLRGQ